MNTIWQEYCDGVIEGRAIFKREGMENARERLDTLNRLCKQFDAANPVGQLFRGERDFWKHKLRA